jgi:multidrug efflux pump subunit AcrB
LKKIIDYFVDHSVVVNLLTVLIIVMGMMSAFSLNKETFPNVDFNFIIIRNMFPGTAPEDVEKLLTLDIERELKEVDGIEELNAMSAEGGVIISIKVDPDYDTDEVLQEVKDAMDRLADMPEDVEEPIITKITNKQRGIMNVALFGEDEWVLREKAKKLRDILEIDKRISKVDLTGYRDEIMDVQVNKDKLEQYDMSLSEIVNAIRDRQINVSAGNIKDPEREKLIRTLVENETLESIQNVVIRSNDIGDAVRVGDVATVSHVLKDKTREDRSNREVAIFLDVFAKSSADILDSAATIKNILEVQSDKMNYKYKIYNDFSFYVKRRLGVLSQNGIQGIFLVTICLILFMNFRVSIITALGAPFAFLVAFSLMESFGVTINLISMFGLIMVLGMLVDDSIIVSEQYYQNLENGMEPRAAAKKAALDTLGPVTATVLTTMVAFGSLFYMEGIMGKFLWSVPAVVIIALAASWLECFIILPGHLADFASKVSPSDLNKDRWYKPWLAFYTKSLNWSLKHAKLTVIFFIAAFILSIITVFTMRFELFPSDDATIVTVNVKGAVGTPFSKTNEQLLRVEEEVIKVLKKEEFVGVKTITGFQGFKGGRSKTGDHYGSMQVELTMSDFRDRSTREIVAALSDGIKKIVPDDFQYSVDLIKNGPPQGKPVNIELYGEDLGELLEVSNQVKEKMLATDGIIAAELDYELGKKQIIIDVNEVEARRLGVSNRQIALEMRRAFEGEAATTIKKSDEDMDVLVRLESDSRKSEDVLKNIRVSNNQGRRVLLTRLATFREVDGAFIIRRFNRKRTMEVSGDIDLKKTTSRDMNKVLKPYVENLLKNHPTITFAMTGENKDTAESLDSFKKAMVASMFIIFIMLVVQFSSMAQPLIIMSAIPFGLIGVVASFKLLGLPIGFMALMGMLGLVGVVINDSIVLVTFINRVLNEEGQTLESLTKATISRFRPVVLTTVTTVAGLLPVAHMPGGDPFLKPMATSFAYGLLFSSAITLIFVPACYKNYMDFGDDIKRWFSWFGKTKKAIPAE